MLFDYLVVGQVLAHNPAHAVRGPRLVVRTGKTPVLQNDEPRTLLDSIAGEELLDLRDRAFVSVLLYSFSRVNTVVGLKVRDYEHQRRRAYLALHEKGGQHRRVPVHSRAAEALDAYLAAAGLGGTPEAPLFQSFAGRTGRLTGETLSARSALRMVKRRAAAAGLGDDLGCHSCRASGITNYLLHGGTLECAAIAGHVQVIPQPEEPTHGEIQSGFESSKRLLDVALLPFERFHLCNWQVNFRGALGRTLIGQAKEGEEGRPTLCGAPAGPG